MSSSIPLLKRVFSVRNLMVALFVLVALVTAWTIFCVEERWRGERKWKNYRAEALQRGTSLEMKDVIPRDIPDAENFAAIPLIQETLKERAPGEPTPKWPIAEKLGDLDLPTELQKRNLPMLDAYRDHFVARGIIPGPANDSAGAILAALKLVGPELQQLREAGRRPNAKFPVHWEKGFATQLPHLAPLRATIRLYRLGMLANLEKGNNDEALQYFRDSMRIFDAMRGEPALISGLVRIAMINSIQEGVVKDGALSRWSDNDLQQIASALAPVDFAADFEFAIQSERALLNTVFDDLLAKSDPELTEFSKAVGIGQTWASVSLYPRGWLRLSQVRANQHFDLVSQRGLQLAKELPADPLLQSGASVFAKLPYLLYVMVVPAFDQVPKTYAHAKSCRDQVLIACALERFRKKSGTYPEKLDVLAPQFIANVPPDPVDGSPMRYRRDADGGFTLWSVGANRVDDGGKPEPDKSPRAQADWVLQVPGKS